MSKREPAPLHLQETAAAPPAIEDDGTVKLQLIRPCVGRGKGRHVYEADMLSKNAHKFGGWPMYIDHETAAERKARGGLPRSVKDIGGIVLESHWDPNVPAEGRFGAGAVVGTVRPIKQVGDLVELHPSLVESSINATAIGVKPVIREGGRAWLVEGIEDKGSVDWVTEGGAGGKVVAALLESIDTSREDQEAELFDSLTDEELREHLSKTRPGVLVEAWPTKGKGKGKSDGDAEDDGPGGDGGADEAEEDLVAKMVKKGMPEALAKKAAKRQLAAKAQEAAVTPPVPAVPPVTTPNEGDAVADVTREQIEEAVLQSPEVATLIQDMVAQGLQSQLTEATTRIRAEAYADAERQIELRDLRDAAHQQIRESRLPEAFATRAMAEFDVTRDGPTYALDVFEAYDDDGNVVKSAEEVLREVVEAVIQDQRELVGSLSKTRVRGQGSATSDGDGDEAKTGKRDTVGPLTRALAMQEAHIDPDKAFGGDLALQG